MTLSVRTQKCLVFGIGAALFLIGCVVGGVWSLIVTAIFEGEMGLTSSSTSYDNWVETPIPIYMEVHFFNWTNPDEYYHDHIKPKYVEMGPYVFSEHHSKVKIQWNDNHTVTFKQVRKWNFVPELSKGSLDDEVTNINVIAVTVEYMIRTMNPLVQIIVDRLVEDVEPFHVTRKVRELAFEGYYDELLNITQELKVPEFQVPMDKFGWFYPRNNSEDYDGVFTMNTGTDDIEKLGIMDAWNYEQYPPYYDGECGRITGSTGELFPPVEGENTLSLFAPEICSSITLAKTNITASRLGLDGYRYIGDDSTFDNGTRYPNRRCYCAKHQVFGLVDKDVSTCSEVCQPRGVRGISKCRFGAPAFISFPHFYLADPSYVANVEGMKPDKTIHETYIDIEPETGIPLAVAARMQINVLLQPYENSKLFSNVTKVMLPALWFTMKAELTSDLADLTKLLLNLPAIGMGTFFGIAGIGALLIVIGTVVTLRRGWKGDEGDKLIVNDSSPTVRHMDKEETKD